MKENKRKVFRCRQCYTINPLGAQRCSKRGCNALLNIHGEVGEVDEYGNWSVIVNHSTQEVEPPRVIMVEPPPVEIKVKEPAPIKVKEPKPVKIKEPKPVKVKESKPPKPPKQPKAYSGESGGSKKTAIVVLLVVVLLLLIATAVGLIWFIANGSSGNGDDSSGKRKTKATSAPQDTDDPADPVDPVNPTDPDTPDPIYAPDFKAYVGNEVKLINTKNKGDYMLYEYEVPHDYALEALDEYVDLLEDKFSFKWSDDYMTTTWFTYTGNLPITTMKSTINGTPYHIELIVKDKANGVYPIEFHFAKEIQLVEPGVYFTKPAPQTYDVPDLLPFSNGYATYAQEMNYTGYTLYAYTVPQGYFDILAKYEDLLKQSYSFEYSGEDVVNKGGATTVYALFTNKEATDVPTLLYTDNNKSIEYHLGIALKISSNEDILAAIIVTDSFQMVNHSHKASVDLRKLPDFEEWAYSNQVIRAKDMDYEGDFYTTQFYEITMNSKTWDAVYQEFCEFIDTQYAFDIVGEGTSSNSNGTVFNNTWYTYNGSEDVSTLTEVSDSGEKFRFQLCIYWYESSDGSVYCGITFVDEINIESPISGSELAP